MLKLLKYAKPYIWMILALAILTYVQVIANLKLPDYTAKIIDDGVIAEQISAIYSNGGMMLLVSLLGGLASVGVGYLAARIATGFARDIRLKAFKNVESFSASEFNTFSTASLITRSTNDVQQVQMVMVMLLRMALMAPFMAVGALQNAINSAPELSWIIAVGVGAVIAMVIFLFGMALPKFKLLQKMVDRLNLVTRENLTGLRVVRAFNREHTEEKKFDTANTDLMNLNLFVNRLMVLMQPFMMLVMNMSLVAIVWFGAQQISTETVAIGNMLAFMQYAVQAIMSFLMFSIIFIMVPRAAVSAGRINEVIETQSSIRDPAKPKKLAAKGQGRVEFREVTYTYPGAENPVLSGISFVAEPGQTTAFIGSTGSGKTTLINLIPRFFDVSAGQILLDGVDIRDLKLSDLYSQIGYVPQKGVLFSGTVKSNVTYGNKKASDSNIKKAAQIAQASDFIAKLDKGLDSEVAQGGTNLSGGQKQRLSIARALAIQPKLYIFDDSFSALDFKTDAALRKALKAETKNKTVLMVGQRIGSIMDADKIIVVDEGKIVGEGTHKELLKNSDVYREIAKSQLSDEELKGVAK